MEASKSSRGRFGMHGGQYMPETLMNAVTELEEAYGHYKDDPDFNNELSGLFNDYAGRPSRLFFCGEDDGRSWWCKDISKKRRSQSHRVP